MHDDENILECIGQYLNNVDLLERKKMDDYDYVSVFAEREAILVEKIISSMDKYNFQNEGDVNDFLEKCRLC